MRHHIGTPNLNRAGFVAGVLGTVATFSHSNGAWASPPAASVAPDEALQRLMDGNKRFVNNDFPAPSKLSEKREMLVEGQAPFASILACADSRIIPNAIFTQGLGDLFVVRVAGNYPDDLVTGSLEYAVEHLGTKLIMVLGHESCGAVKATYDAIASGSILPKHLLTIQRLIGPGIGTVIHDHGSEDAAVKANVRAAVTTLKTAHPVIAEAVKAGHVRVVGAEYRLAHGVVELID